MKKNWIVRDKFELPTGMMEKYHPIVLKLLANRGIQKSDEIGSFFNFDYEKDLGDPFLVVGMEKAAERVKTALEKKERVAIFGDYDADGVSASAVLYETLEEIGFKEVLCYIPDRQLEGYGMNEKAVNYLAEQKVSLIITVDCGITNHKEIKKAGELGMDVIVTDHHNVPEILPEAYVCLNPNITGSGFVSKDLAGVGVAFKFSQSLFFKMAPERVQQLKWKLDLVALGTIADCVPLLGENRTLAKFGLIVLSKTRRVGLQEVFKVGRIEINEGMIPDAHRVAFQIAPRINAAGRMDHANVSYKLLIEKNPVAARTMALEVESSNQRRQKVTAEIFKDVQSQAESRFKDKPFIYAESPNWPVGILGLVAGKITEEFNKPTVVFQRQEKEYVGSLRSIPEVDIMKMLRGCQELLRKFGGHSQAAGVSVSHDQKETFCQKMSALIEKELKGKKFEPRIEIDCEISPEDINWELMAELKKMEPFGEGNPEPVFQMKNLLIAEAKIVGNGQKHWKLALRAENGSPKIFDAIAFSTVEKFPDLKAGDKIDIIFNLNEDQWNGNNKIQLNIIDLKIT